LRSAPKVALVPRKPFVGMKDDATNPSLQSPGVRS